VSGSADDVFTSNSIKPFLLRQRSNHVHRPIVKSAPAPSPIPPPPYHEPAASEEDTIDAAAPFPEPSNPPGRVRIEYCIDDGEPGADVNPLGGAQHLGTRRVVCEGPLQLARPAHKSAVRRPSPGGLGRSASITTDNRADKPEGTLGKRVKISRLQFAKQESVILSNTLPQEDQTPWETKPKHCRQRGGRVTSSLVNVTKSSKSGLVSRGVQYDRHQPRALARFEANPFVESDDDEFAFGLKRRKFASSDYPGLIHGNRDIERPRMNEIFALTRFLLPRNAPKTPVAARSSDFELRQADVAGAPPVPSGVRHCDDWPESCRRFIMTHRARPPYESEEEETEEDEQEPIPIGPGPGRDSGFGSRPTLFQSPEPPPDPRIKITVRFLLNLVCIAYIIFVTALLISRGTRCSDGASLKLLDHFFFDLFVLLLVVMPAVGWLVILVEVTVSSLGDVFEALRRNPL